MDVCSHVAGGNARSIRVARHTHVCGFATFACLRMGTARVTFSAELQPGGVEHDRESNRSRDGRTLSVTPRSYIHGTGILTLGATATPEGLYIESRVSTGSEQVPYDGTSTATLAYHSVQAWEGFLQ